MRNVILSMLTLVLAPLASSAAFAGGAPDTKPTSFLVVIEGTVVSTNVDAEAGGSANVPNLPKPGAKFRGSFVYTPNQNPIPRLFTKIHFNFGSFTVARMDGVGDVMLINNGGGIQYADGDSEGFTNISLPAAGWQLDEFDMSFTNPANEGPVVDPAKLNFNLFTERDIFLAADNGDDSSAELVFTLLGRIDSARVLPAPL